MDDRSNIVLTGFMGTGKSTVGRLLAGSTAREFVDTDAVIEGRHGPIHEIFAQQGEERFRQLERDVAHELGNERALVIATGGRMMLDAANIASFRDARVFTLVADAEEIHRRISSGSGPIRPLLEVDDPLGRIRALLAERTAGYSLFPGVRSGGRSPDAVAREVARLVDRGTTELSADEATVELGVAELPRWSSRVGDAASCSFEYGTGSAERYAAVLGDNAERHGEQVVAVGGLPPERFALYIPTELPSLLWWITHPEARGAALVDVGVFVEDQAGLAMLDQYLTEFTDAEVRPWSRPAGVTPGLLEWLLDALEAVCARHGFSTA